MKLYAITDEYINYLRQFDSKVYDNKEDLEKAEKYCDNFICENINFESINVYQNIKNN